jgi:hypothetical protein
MSGIDTLANAIATMEGFYTSGSVAQRNNNPGNLTASPYATGNVNGYSVFPDAATGMEALQYQLQLYASRGLTLDQMFNGIPAGQNSAYPNGFPGYAPSGTTSMTTGNDPGSYLSYVLGQLGVGADTSLSALYDTATAATTTVSTNVSQGDTGDTSSEDGSSVLSFLSSGLFNSDGSISTGGWIGVGLGVVGLGIWLVNR